MPTPPADHGYIDYDGPDELFWKIETLWAAAHECVAEELPLDDVAWRDDGCFILGDPPRWGLFAEHCRRAMQADLSHPVIIGPKGDVMDGMHRIVRAFVEGRSTVPAVRLAAVPPPDRIRPRTGGDADVRE
jgi:hypothetical protein